MIILITVLAVIILISTAILDKTTGFFAYHLNKHRVKIIRDLQYVDGSDNPRHRLDVYLPKDATDFPIVHFIHGGYWNSSDKNHRQWISGLYGNLGCALARRGVGVVISNYRLIPIYTPRVRPIAGININDQIDDVARSIGWTLGHRAEWTSADQVYVMGHSSGAHLISLLAANPKYYRRQKVDPSPIKGYIALSPILDIESMVRTHDPEFNRRVSFTVFGDKPTGWQDYSPLHHFKNTRPNTKLTVAIGENDFEYIRRQIPAAIEAMKIKDITATLNVIPGYNHTDMVTRFGHRNDRLTQLVLDIAKN